MGLFGNSYSKPGPGVSKDEPKKKGIALYFQMFFRHFWDFFKENMMYVIASIPMLVILYIVVSLLDLFGIQKWVIENNAIEIYEMFKVFIVLSIVILCGSGPASAGMAHMMRCVTREEHCFLLSDFIEKFKENFKHTFLLSVIDIVVLMLLLPVAIRFYHFQYTATQGLHWFALLIVMVILTMFYLMMHIYFYQFAITFELSFAKTLKNSFIMAIAYLPLNLLIMAIPVVMTYILSSFITPPVVLMLALFFWIAFMRYPIEFLASRVILNKLLTNNKENEE